MPGSNGYASMVWNRAKKKKADARAKAKGKRPRGKRRRLDNYETPPRNTFQLAAAVAFKGPILEPAQGSGRMVRALKEALRKSWGRMRAGTSIVGMDLKDGPQFDFLKRTAKWKGDIITNPPYGKGLSDAFAYKALELADGRVALLVELKFLTGDKRATKLFLKYPPELVIIVPERIYFIAGAKPIPAQFYNHCWIVWPRRAVRDAMGKRGRIETKMIWANPKAVF